MTSPKTVKEVQKLIERITALNRFVSKVTDKCLPFFKTLKQAFFWTDECVVAFQELKHYLSNLPLLSPPKEGEDLYLYLAVSVIAVSATLIREEGRKQLPVYYVSQAFQRAESRTDIKAQVLADFIAEFIVPAEDNVDEEVDVRELVKKCDKCQRFKNVQHLPVEKLTMIASLWPFVQCGIDIIGPLPRRKRQVKFLLVAIDYFTKWVEAEAILTITEEKIQSFLWKNIICRFGIPRTIISDNKQQFDS
ncbi:uncharacterized protein LOC142628761 [Castanea sativa]|uniref:uncharacterized protein LOC142628761 n=1 Tax=Castanea sativa TaxID=21020 RepID=UPI003F64FE49